MTLRACAAPTAARCLTLAGLAGCLDIPSAAEDHVVGRLDGNQGVTLTAFNDGAREFEIHIHGGSDRRYPMPDQLIIGERGADANLLGTTLAPDRESLSGILAGSTVRVSADTPVSGPSATAPTLTLAGPGVAQVVTSWDAVDQPIAGTSVFTMYPDGRLVRTDTVFVSEPIMAPALASYVAFAPTAFGTYVGADRPEDPVPLATASGAIQDIFEAVCLGPGALASGSLGIAVKSGSRPIATQFRRGIDANGTWAASFDWAVADGQLAIDTYTQTTVLVASADQDCTGVHELLAGDLVPARITAVQAGNELVALPAHADDGSYAFKLDGLGDVTVTADEATTQGFALALEGEPVRFVRVDGAPSPEKGPPLVQVHRTADLVYIWIPSALQAGQSITLHLER